MIQLPVLCGVIACLGLAMPSEHALASALSASVKVDPDQTPHFPSTPEAVGVNEEASQGFTASLSFPNPQMQAQYNNDATYSKWRVTGVLFLPRNHTPTQRATALSPTPPGAWTVSSSSADGAHATLKMSFDKEGDYTVGVAVDAAWTTGAGNARASHTGTGTASVKLSVRAIKLASQTVATAPKNKDPERTTIGVGEVVNLTLEGSNKDNPITWALAPQNLGVALDDLKPAVFNKQILTASDKEGKVTVTATYQGKQYSLSFTIKAPTGMAKGVIVNTLVPDWKLPQLPVFGIGNSNFPVLDVTEPGAGVVIHNVVLPEEVSFVYIGLEEKDCAGSSPTGCFDPKANGWNHLNVSRLNHKKFGAFRFTRPSADNSLNDRDSAYGRSVWGSSWTGGGTWQWQVPLVWRLEEKGTQDHPFPVDWGTAQAKEAGWTCLNSITQAGVVTKTKNKALTTRNPLVAHRDNRGRVTITRQPTIVAPAKEIQPISVPLTLTFP